VTFTITAHNGGPAAATGVTVSDTLPAGLTLVTAVPTTGTYAAGVWTIGSLANGVSATLTITATVTGTSAMTNTATISGAQTDSNAANNTASATVTPQQVDLGVVVTDSADPVTVGSGFSYSVVVTNHSAQTATTVVIHDTLPAGVTFVSAVPGAGTCSFASPTLTCNLASLAGSGSVTITINVTAASAGTVVDTANVSATQFDPVPANNSATQSTTINGTPSITATKAASLAIDADSNGIPSPGDTLLYTITIHNSGTGDATNVVFADTPGANTTLVAGSITTTAGSVTGNVSVNVGTLAAGATATITFRVTIANPLPAGVTTVSNQGQVTSTELPPVATDDPSTPAPGDPTVTSVTAAPMISATKSASLAVDADNNGVPSPGDTLLYTITIHNSGNSAATNVVFTDTPDANTTLVAGSITTTAGSVSGNVAVNIGSLAGGASATITFRVTIANPLPAGVTTVTNQGQISSSELPTVPTDDPSTPPAGDSTTTAVTAAPILSVTKAATLAVDADNNGVPSPGDTLLYTVLISNSGNAAATNVVFTDTPGANTTLVPASIQTSAGSVTGNVAVNAGTIAGGASVTITFRVTIASPLPAGVTTVSNQGQVTSNELPTVLTDDPSTPPVGDPTTTAVTAAPILSATKAATLFVDADSNGVPSPGDTLLYTITVSNTGNSAATNVVFTDTPGANTALVAGSIQTSAGSVTGNVAVNIGTLAGGSSATITFRVTIVNPLPAGVTSVSNQGAVSSNELPSVPTDDPSTPQPGDPTVTQVTATPVLVASKSAVLSVDADNNGVPSPGDTLLYTVVITNSGNAAATNVVFTDTPGANTTLVPGSVQTSAGTVTGNIAVNLGTINGGASATITFRVTIANPLPAGVTTVSNQGQISSSQLPTVLTDDPSTAPVGDPTVTAVTAAPILSATKSATLAIDADNNGIPSPGDTLLYTITINNTGNSAATNVNFTDTPDANTSIVPGSIQTTTGSVTGSVVVNLGTLPGNTSATITFRVTIANPLPAGVKTISNQGHVTSNELPPVPTDDPSTPAPGDPTVTGVTSAPILSATKSATLAIDADGNGIPSPGDTLLYSINIANSGNSAATNVVLTDTPDANTSVVPGSIQTSAGSVTGSVVVNIGTLAAGTSATITFRVTIANPLPAGVTTIRNQGQVTSSELPPVPTDDPSTPATGDSTITPVVQGVDLGVTVSDSADPVAIGSNFQYTIIVTNHSVATGTNVVLTDTLPSGVTFVSVTTTAGTCTGSSTLTCNVASLGGGASFTVTVTVNAASTGTVTDTASVSGNETDPVPANNSASQPTTIVSGPALRVTKTAALATDADNNGVVSPGDTLLYTIVVQNVGASSASNVTLSDTPDANTSVVAGSVQTTMGSVTGSVAVNIGTLAAGSSATITFRATIANPFPAGVSSVSNQALATSSNAASASSDDPSTVAPLDPTITPVVVPPAALPDLTIAKTADVSAPREGAVSTFTITVVNRGTTPIANVLASDLLPSGLAYLSATASAGSYASSTGDWTIGTLSAGASATLSVRATVAKGTAGRTITNCATIMTTNGDPSNDRACASIAPVTAPAAACTNRPPVVSAPDLATVAVGSTLHFNVAAIDPDDDPITLSATGLPSAAHFDPATGEFTFTPTDLCDAEDDVYAPTFTAADGAGGFTSVPVRITVGREYIPKSHAVARHDGGPAPVFSIPTGPIGDEAGTPLRFKVVARSQSDACTSDVTLTTPGLGTFDAASGTFTWSPNTSVVPMQTVAFRATDCNGRTATATIAIRNGFVSGHSALVGVRALTFAPVTTSASRSAVVSLTNSGASEVRVDSLKLAAGDSFRIEGVTRLPILIEPSHTVDLNVIFEPATVGALSDTLAIATSDSPTPLTMDLAGTGTAAEQSAGTNDAPEFLPVQPYVDRGPFLPVGPQLDGATRDACTNRPPVISAPSQVLAAIGQTLRFRIAAIDPDGDTVSIGVASLPAGASFDSTNGLFTYTPQQACGDLVDAFSDVTFIAIDSQGGSSSVPVRIVTVQPAPSMVSAPPIVSVPTHITALPSEAVRFRVVAEGGCANAVTPLVNIGAFDATTGQFTYRAPEGGSGSVRVPFRAVACDGSTTTAVATIDFGPAARSRSVDAIDFGSTMTGASNGYTIVPFVNHGTTPLAVTSVSFRTGSDFRVNGGAQLPIELQPGEELPLRITFEPHAEGPSDDTIVVSTNSTEGPVTIHFTGTGVK